jgi:tetratricopeptide (TPR) repeat protein
MKVVLKVIVSLVVCSVLGLAACRRGNAVDEHTDTPGSFDPCVMALAPHQGTGDVDPAIARSQQRAREAADPVTALNELAQQFVARARTSEVPTYYAMAEHTALCVESKDPGNAQALLLRGHVLHQFHRFGEAEVLARQLVATRGLFLDYGLLGDVLLEQGRIPDANDAYQKMIDLKPHYHSYTRAAHLRWITGDLPGALELIGMAIKAASPRDPESIAWAHSRLAAYELQAGRPEAALRAVDAALHYQPDYAAALLVRGRTLMSDGKAAEAVEAFRRAALKSPLPEHEWALADGLRATANPDEAQVVEERLHRSGATTDPRTFALYLATRRERIDEAVALARKELTNRADVFTYDALAWSLAAAGRIAEADDAMKRALAEGTQDARLFYHAGVIASMRGERAEASRWLGKALATRQMLLPSERQDLTRQLADLKRQAHTRRVRHETPDPIV